MAISIKFNKLKEKTKESNVEVYQRHQRIHLKGF